MKKTTALIGLPLITAVIVLGAAAAGGVAVDTRSGEEPGDRVEVRGKINSWILNKNGSVVFRLEPLRPMDGREISGLWFRTPSTQNADIRVEVQMLDMIREVASYGDQEGVPVTVVGDGDDRRNGLEPKRAIPMEYVSMP